MAPSPITPVKREFGCQAQNKSLTSVADKSKLKYTGDTFVSLPVTPPDMG